MDPTDTAAFLESFRNLTESKGWGRPLSPARLIEQWDTFVGSCEEGYSESIEEFWNDRDIRRILEAVIKDSTLAEFDQISWVRAEVSAIDERYRTLLTDHDVRSSANWWEVRIPRFAGRELADDFKAHYQVDVEVRE